jgi:hypothetical protein
VIVVSNRFTAIAGPAGAGPRGLRILMAFLDEAFRHREGDGRGKNVRGSKHQYNVPLKESFLAIG